MLDELGKFYFYISVPLEDCRVVEWGSGDFGRIFRLCKQCDKFKSNLATKKGGRYNHDDPSYFDNDNEDNVDISDIHSPQVVETDTKSLTLEE
ncbi:hypothetical protein C2G38_2213948 [Gigaspora rosea]|uniref:Uncharacterized protein n=1 Tax=Gigaspora rosea TaxID=44941 RepID=A0A397UKF3_9GLOM|nr:hypothetical protein C2G38_2213948 [Gigaspora rosea]